MRYKLYTELTYLFVLCFRIIWIGFFGFLIYSSVISDLSAILFLSFSNFMIGVFYIKKIKGFRLIEFDENFIYFNQKSVKMDNIKEISFGKIILKDKLNEPDLFFYQLPGLNQSFNLLKKFYYNSIV